MKKYLIFDKSNQNMKKINLKIHSFIDIITNSSTEIYIQATSQTISNIKSLVNSILSIGGSTLKCDDIFTIKLEDEERTGGYDDEFTDVGVEVNPLIEGADAKIASAILSDLTGLFGIDAQYDG